MRLVLKQSQPAFTVQQAGLAPVVALNFGPAGSAQPLSGLPDVDAVFAGDRILIVRSGALYSATITQLQTLLASLSDDIVLES